MCLILFAHKAHSDYPLILAANRDEAYERPAAPAAFWKDHPGVYGGRDLDKGGTWLGMRLDGRIAAVTNFRSGKANGAPAPVSRGALVSDFLMSERSTEAYLHDVKMRGSSYNGFILIAGDLRALYWLSNRGPGVERIPPGVHGLSNHLLNTPWPKIKRSTEALQALLAAPEAELTPKLFELLADRSAAPDDELPDTGIGIQRERELSPLFICSDRYGTRASTVILVNRDGDVTYVERSFGPQGKPLGEVSSLFRLDPISSSTTVPGAAKAGA